ncbi:unnamed protein product [Protopolystoma xenopodis]|uniref:Uncharacterized protein n=1 Tax=Protopolystoma xenopodis TaxID=117903 RepID=A0A3S5CF95_9PLAT|nr:unnamed protein product [Protopolystoma xenopodis]
MVSLLPLYDRIPLCTKSLHDQILPPLDSTDNFHTIGGETRSNAVTTSYSTSRLTTDNGPADYNCRDGEECRPIESASITKQVGSPSVKEFGLQESEVTVALPTASALAALNQPPWLNSTALNNEFLTKALLDYPDRQARGEFVQRIRHRAGLRASAGNRRRYLTGPSLSGSGVSSTAAVVAAASVSSGVGPGGTGSTETSGGAVGADASRTAAVAAIRASQFAAAEQLLKNATAAAAAAVAALAVNGSDADASGTTSTKILSRMLSTKCSGSDATVPLSTASVHAEKSQAMVTESEVIMSGIERVGAEEEIEEDDDDEDFYLDARGAASESSSFTR